MAGIPDFTGQQTFYGATRSFPCLTHVTYGSSTINAGATADITLLTPASGSLMMLPQLQVSTNSPTKCRIAIVENSTVTWTAYFTNAFQMPSGTGGYWFWTSTDTDVLRIYNDDAAQKVFEYLVGYIETAQV